MLRRTLDTTLGNYDKVLMKYGKEELVRRESSADISLLASSITDSLGNILESRIAGKEAMNETRDQQISSAALTSQLQAEVLYFEE